MKIIAFADLHYFAGNIEKAIFNTSTKLVAYALPLLDALTEIINKDSEVDLAINLGDVIQDTTEHDADIEALKFIFGRLGAIRPPCYSVLGNHELKMMDSALEVEEIMGRKSSLSIDMDGWHLVFLSTEVRPELGTERGGCYKAQYLAEETLKWFGEDLAKTELPTMVFTHFALAEDESVTDPCMFMKNRGEVKKIINESGKVKAVFYGHQHKTKSFIENGIPYYMLGSMITPDGKEGEPAAVYLEIETYESGELSIVTRKIEKY